MREYSKEVHSHRCSPCASSVLGKDPKVRKTWQFALSVQFISWYYRAIDVYAILVAQGAVIVSCDGTRDELIMSRKQ